MVFVSIEQKRRLNGRQRSCEVSREFINNSLNLLSVEHCIRETKHIMSYSQPEAPKYNLRNSYILGTIILYKFRPEVVAPPGLSIATVHGPLAIYGRDRGPAVSQGSAGLEAPCRACRGTK